MSLLIFLVILIASFAFILTMVTLSQRNLTKEKTKSTHAQISDAGVRELVAQGQLDEAADIYRRFTGVDMFTAKSAVEALAIELRLSDSEPEIQRLLRLGDKAGAIEIYQQATGEPLAEALAAVEAREQQKGR